MSDLATAEYVELRRTIRTRGTARPLAFLAGIAAWALALTAVLVWLPSPLLSVVPLVLLVAAFETVRTLHLGVERIGRYVQVFYEGVPGSAPTGPPAWEHGAMTFGPALPGAGGHPLFLPVFLLAAGVNFLAVLLPGPIPVELGALAVPHVAFLVWMLRCDRGMRRQRATELDRFRTIRTSMARQPSSEDRR